MFEYTPADIANQIASQPLLVAIWLRVLGVVNLASAFFLRRVQARWVLGAFLFIAATNIPIFLSSGLTKLGSVPHLIVWIPLIIYLAREFRSGHIEFKSSFGIWCVIVLLVNLISVVFDVRDSIQYLQGDHEPMTVDPNAEAPIMTLLAIVASIILVFGYSFGFGRRDAANQ
ncbi:MAG: hypothetical protein ACR2PZ_17630 [Pseudomonadales bacterium]